MRIRNSLGLALTTIALITAINVGVEAKQTEYEESIVHTYITEDSAQIKCLALNVYFEARGESRIGQKAVAWVTLNRVKSGKYANNICDVVWDSDQFAWTNDGKSDKPKDIDAYVEALSIAYDVITEYGYAEDPTEGAIMFHSSSVKPYWKNKYERVIRIDNHIFYKETDNG